MQAAVKIVLEPVFEADMLACSFGFRPRRATHDALQVLVDESWRGRRWVVETDIANCFEAIPHQGLMRAVQERVSDQSVLKLLRVMLRAGVMSDVQRGQIHRVAAQGVAHAAGSHQHSEIICNEAGSQPGSAGLPGRRLTRTGAQCSRPPAANPATAARGDRGRARRRYRYRHFR